MDCRGRGKARVDFSPVSCVFCYIELGIVQHHGPWPRANWVQNLSSVFFEPWVV